MLQAIAFSALACHVQGTVLVLEQSRSSQQFGCIALFENRFELSFIHSVSLTTVFDAYQVTGNKNDYRMVQTQERFSAHGQGLPSLVDEPDSIAFESIDGQFILSLNRPIHHLIVRTDKRFKNRLYTGAEQYNLNQWPDTGISVVIRDQCPSTLKFLAKN